MSTYNQGNPLTGWEWYTGGDRPMYGLGSWDSGDSGSNTLGARFSQGLLRDPISQYAMRHTSGWLRDPGAAVLHWLSGPEAPAPAAPPPQMRQLQSTPGAANPAGNVVAQMRSAALRKPQKAQQLGGQGQQVNFGAAPNYQQKTDFVPYPDVQ